MRYSGRALFTAIVLVTSAAGVGIAACGGGERPAVDDTNRKPTNSIPLNEAGTSFEVGGGDAVVETCVNTIKDGNETDVDCGGNACGKCIDGKVCIAKTDCAGGACLEGKCATPACTNKEIDGDETDIDCGGELCARCTIGKRCLQNGDCVSGTCANALCRCPKGMIEASRAGGGGAYCIDEIEVTKYQYNKFITANVPIKDQESVCKPPANTTFIPRNAWPPLESPPSLPTPGTGTSFNFSLPVHYVDWCDAFAYCKWAGKQLCGSVTGGAVAFEKANLADAGAWFNACSAQGEIPYPYGNDFFSGKCNGDVNEDAGTNKSCGPPPQFSGYGCAENKDDGIHASNNGDS
ncbi:MAG: SUMF1/EgtB/PvdO family nonheme iron enzyme, partial [Phycisphaerales bacterium]|nr:SUMF1/EgtB/PvdO family nonheme iron enzyme [Phycisphaerales bacterium]